MSSYPLWCDDQAPTCDHHIRLGAIERLTKRWDGMQSTTDTIHHYENAVSFEIPFVMQWDCLAQHDKVMMVAINCVISWQVSWQPTDKLLLIVLIEGLVEIFFPTQPPLVLWPTIGNHLHFSQALFGVISLTLFESSRCPLRVDLILLNECLHEVASCAEF